MRRFLKRFSRRFVRYRSDTTRFRLVDRLRERGRLAVGTLGGLGRTVDDGGDGRGAGVAGLGVERVGQRLRKIVDRVLHQEVRH